MASPQLENIFVNSDNNKTLFQITPTHSRSGDNVAGAQNINQSRTLSRSGNAQVTASGAAALSLGNISGTVANTINQLPSFDNEPHKQELKELLTQLQTTVLATDLDDEDRTRNS